MNFPVLEVPLLGGELLMAGISLVFAISAFFAVGGGTFQVLLERRALREGNQALLSFLQDWSRFFLLMTVIVGFVSWLGIWVGTVVLAPSAAFALLRILFWVFSAISLLLVVQGASALLYHSAWGVVRPADHARIGWIFAVSAWLTLFALNGIMTFMLTPGEWLATGRLVDAFFNPTFWPSALMLASEALGLAGLICLVAISREESPALKGILVSASSAMVIPGFILLPAGALWLAGTMPEGMRFTLLREGSGVTFTFLTGLVLCLLVLLLGSAGPFRRPLKTTSAMALLLLVLGVGAIAAIEATRGMVRSPYAIAGYLYINGLDARAIPRMRERGFLKQARYARVRSAGDSRAGRAIFRLQCMSCHSVDGWNSIRQAMHGWDREVIVRQLSRLSSLKGRMPPFAGTEEEKRALADYLRSLERESAPSGERK